MILVRSEPLSWPAAELVKSGMRRACWKKPSDKTSEQAGDVTSACPCISADRRLRDGQ